MCCEIVNDTTKSLHIVKNALVVWLRKASSILAGSQVGNDAQRKRHIVLKSCWHLFTQESVSSSEIRLKLLLGPVLVTSHEGAIHNHIESVADDLVGGFCVIHSESKNDKTEQC